MFALLQVNGHGSPVITPAGLRWPLVSASVGKAGVVPGDRKGGLGPGSGGSQSHFYRTVDGAGWQAHVFTMLVLLPLCPTGRVHEKLKLLREHFSRKQTSNKKIMVLCFLCDPEQVTSPLWASTAPPKNKLDVYGHVKPHAWRTLLSASDVLALDVG